ncbi:GntR family transcriptional regulator [Nesterenkonia sp. CL21]|uniref:FadR/GntR family transcriptional regulator n=1 Tax=Nesterenkonia sp. CL21 TaxID=3064894 RepID=UPI00287A0A8E|nr:GntR family transcriptional regulator [Nesterenkonia sp. CL21]MDS2173535.1 GntR family transcriptional regulator [Nesterenkonia sp. CL21]
MTVSSAHSSRMHAAIFNPLGEEGRAALVTARLSQGIRAGVLRDGQRLPNEFELAGSFGVAVVTVREALGTLRDQGLITTRRGRNGGSFVSTSHQEITRANERLLASMSRVALTDLCHHYRAIAVACAELACRRATDDDVAVLAGIVDSLPQVPTETWRAAVSDVQLELAALGGSARLTREHMTLQRELLPLLALQDDEAAARRAHEDHLRGHLQAVRVHDADAARGALTRSVEHTQVWLLERRGTLQAQSHQQHDATGA